MKTSRTRSQQRILDVFKSLDREVSAKQLYVELHQQGQSVGLATIYRSLEALKRDGDLQVRILPTGESVYSSLQQDRHHLTCLNCGASVAINACPVGTLQKELSQTHEFKMCYHTLEFFGVCNRCQTA
ncbi:MAG: transcriptional repressor [Cyanobacteria bacterium P01_H01_bin.15]